jgi:hypothetical protein
MHSKGLDFRKTPADKVTFVSIPAVLGRTSLLVSSAIVSKSTPLEFGDPCAFGARIVLRDVVSRFPFPAHSAPHGPE